MQIMRKGVKAADISADGIIAYITDTQLNTDKPVYHLADILGIISFIESLKEQSAIGG